MGKQPANRTTSPSEVDQRAVKANGAGRHRRSSIQTLTSRPAKDAARLLLGSILQHMRTSEPKVSINKEVDGFFDILFHDYLHDETLTLDEYAADPREFVCDQGLWPAIGNGLVFSQVSDFGATECGAYLIRFAGLFGEACKSLGKIPSLEQALMCSVVATEIDDEYIIDRDDDDGGRYTLTITESGETKLGLTGTVVVKAALPFWEFDFDLVANFTEDMIALRKQVYKERKKMLAQRRSNNASRLS